MKRLVSPPGSSCVFAFSGLFAILAWLSPVAVGATYGGGSGTAGDPYLIQTAEQFVEIGRTPADWGSSFRLVSDIDLSDYDQTTLQPIGRWVSQGNNANQPFHGSFDGGGKTIRGFRFKDMKAQYVGLFCYVTGDITDLHLVRPNVVADNMGVGALVGYLGSGGLSGCSVTGASVSGNEEVGALVGLVDGRLYACWSTGSVTGARYVGGLVGRIGSGTVVGSYSKAAVAGNDSVGGFVGGVSKELGLVDCCYAKGRVQGGIYVGGLVGQLVAGQVFRCYSVGRVTGSQALGGLVGYKRAQGQTLGSLWDTEASGQATSAGGTGKTTAEMKMGTPYLDMNWDFGSTWIMCEGLSYPILQWQIPAGDFTCPDGVNFTDFAWFAAQWRSRACGQANGHCSGVDLDQSGEVDWPDLALFSANWLAGVE